MKLLLTSLGILAAALCAIFSSNFPVLATEATCDKVSMVFARGSGEDLNDQNQQRFKNQLEARLSTSLSWDDYELGSDSHKNPYYPAVNISDVLNSNAEWRTTTAEVLMTASRS